MMRATKNSHCMLFTLMQRTNYDDLFYAFQLWKHWPRWEIWLLFSFNLSKFYYFHRDNIGLGGTDTRTHNTQTRTISKYARTPKLAVGSWQSAHNLDKVAQIINYLTVFCPCICGRSVRWYRLHTIWANIVTQWKRLCSNNNGYSQVYFIGFRV